MHADKISGGANQKFAVGQPQQHRSSSPVILVNHDEGNFGGLTETENGRDGWRGEGGFNTRGGYTLAMTFKQQSLCVYWGGVRLSFVGAARIHHNHETLRYTSLRETWQSTEARCSTASKSVRASNAHTSFSPRRYTSTRGRSDSTTTYSCNDGSCL